MLNLLLELLEAWRPWRKALAKMQSINEFDKYKRNYKLKFEIKKSEESW